MAIRFFVIPAVVEDGLTGPIRRPKYVFQLSPPITYGDWMDYGLEDAFLCGIDVTGAQRASLSSHADVTTVPANIDNAIGGSLAAVQQALEDLKIPSDWVTSVMTYREVLAKTGRLFQFLQRFHGRHLKKLFRPGITLDSTMGDFTATERQEILDVAAEFQIPTGGVTLSTPLRQVLKIIADNMPPFTLAGETF